MKQRKPNPSYGNRGKIKDPRCYVMRGSVKRCSIALPIAPTSSKRAVTAIASNARSAARRDDDEAEETKPKLWKPWKNKRPKVLRNARLCKALLDRVTDRAHIIETGSDSYRFKRTLELRGRHARSKPTHGAIPNTHVS